MGRSGEARWFRLGHPEFLFLFLESGRESQSYCVLHSQTAQKGADPFCTLSTENFGAYLLLVMSLIISLPREIIDLPSKVPGL